MTHSNPTRRTKLEDLATVQRLTRERDLLPPAERNHQRLHELRKFVDQLQSTDGGKRELQRRRSRYGNCTQGRDESELDFYCRLRTWLDRGLD